jgi:hypothetical protein
MQRVRLACCILTLLATSAPGDDISLVRVGETWRYYRGTNEPSSSITAWRETAFDDSGWAEGPSGFSTTAYSETVEATYWNQLPPATTSHSFYLRRKFTVADPQAVAWLVLRVDYNDGFVAYLNGHEIVRRGLTNDPVAYDDYAEQHPGGTAEEFDVTSAGLLVAGENVLAIQVHTATTNLPGYDNSIRLVPELLANFQRGPFVANASTNAIQVVWRTPVITDSTVEFGTNQILGAQISDSTLTTNHVLTLTGLLAGTEYFYRIRSTWEGGTAVSPIFSFHTFKPSGGFTFLVTGDSEDGSVRKYQLVRLIEKSKADLVLHCGDHMYDSFRLGSEDYRTLSVYGQKMRSVPFYFSLGNHDIHPTYFDQPFLQTFCLPTNTVTGTSHFYSFDHGDGHFAVLFLPWLTDVPELRPYQLTNGSPQYCWLTNDLATSTKPWKFLFMHIPFANSGHHSLDDDNNNGIPDRVELQQMLLPIAQRYGVQIVFSGHEHDYERSNPMGGVYHVVIGGGGSLQPNDYFRRDQASSQFYLTNGLVKVAVHGDSLLLQAIGTNGAVFDSMTIQRRPPSSQIYSASWHTPSVPAMPADDGHGNINGQTFDFIGTPVPALSGKFSNLGRVYVNNDATNLFIGFKQAMIYSNQNIFLFVESPRQMGVTNLVGLGNSTPGTPEGVEGLDLLQNLWFTNFTPTVACLLGDEYADGQDRFFARPGLDLQLGQGVFRLDSGFSDVTGIRLQQFNRSPQVLEPPRQLLCPEQNANFIEVAIPFSQLGGLRPGDTIKIGAVVGMGGYDTNAQTRDLDTGYLGSLMVGAGQSNVVLGGVSVRLAPAILTVRADDQARAYGTSNSQLTVTYTGFMDGDSPQVLGGSPALSTLADLTSAVGTYPIKVGPGSLTSDSYSFNFVNGTLAVTPRVITVAAENQTRPYGATNGPLTLDYSGFGDGHVTNILSGSVGLSTPAQTNSPVGEYPIIVSQDTLAGSNTNYAFVFVPGTLAITPAATATALASSYDPGTSGPRQHFTATVSPVAPATATPTGIVRFLTNGALMATSSLLDGQASISADLLSPSAAVVQAQYGGDGNFLPSTDTLQLVLGSLDAPPCSSGAPLLSIGQAAGQSLSILLLGTTNAQYYLLTSTNLATPIADWTILTDSTNVAINGVWTYTTTNGTPDDLVPPGGIRFFRVRAANPCP